MSDKLVVKKGYTIEVTSWENDGDNYKTKTLTVDDKEQSIAILDMCKNLFTSHHDTDNTGIGNMMDAECKNIPLYRYDNGDVRIDVNRVLVRLTPNSGDTEYTMIEFKKPTEEELNQGYQYI